MAKYVGYKRPKDTKKTLKRMLHYMGIHKWSMALVAVLVVAGIVVAVVRKKKKNG